MSEMNEHEGITPQDFERGFVGGSIVLSVEHDWNINNQKVHESPNIKIFDLKGKKAVIRTKGAYDTLVAVLTSKRGKAHRELLPETLPMDENI